MALLQNFVANQSELDSMLICKWSNFAKPSPLYIMMQHSTRNIPPDPLNNRSYNPSGPNRESVLGHMLQRIYYLITFLFSQYPSV